MITHVVMWRLAANSDDQKKKDALTIRTALEALPEKISALSSLQLGDNINPTDMAYDLVLISTHESLDALEEYRVHPEHKKVVEIILPLVSSRAVVDFEA